MTKADGTKRVASAQPVSQNAFVPAARGRAFARASVWLAPALVHGLISWHILSDVRLGMTSGTSTVVTVALIALLIPFALTGIAMVVLGLRWLLLALWPGRVGVTADARSLRLAFGPFGTRTYDVKRLDAKYLFELSIDVVEEGFEALLPDEEQVEHFLPRLLHPDAKDPVNRAIIRYCGGTETEVAHAMRPVIAHWRGEDPTVETIE